MWSAGVVTATVAGVQYSVQFVVAMHLVQQTHNVVAQLIGQHRVLRLRNTETESESNKTGKLFLYYVERTNQQCYVQKQDAK